MDPFNDPPRDAPPPPGGHTPHRTPSRSSVRLTDLGAQPYGADPAASIASRTTVNDPFDDPAERNQSGYYSSYQEEESIPLTDA